MLSLSVSVSAACEGQHALVHTMHVQPSFPPHDVTAHSDEHDSRGALLAFGVFSAALQRQYDVIFRQLLVMFRATSDTSRVN